MEETMRYLLIILLLIGSIALFAQAMPRAILVSIQTADGSALQPSDIFIRAYFKERPEEIQTSITRPKHFNTHIGKSHKGFYAMLNPSAFSSAWAPGETLIADITQVSTGATVRFTLVMTQGGSPIWFEDPLTLTHPVPGIASSPNPADKSKGIPSNLATVGWTYNPEQGYSKPVAFRLAIDTDSLFSNASVFYIKSNKKNVYTHVLSKKLVPLKENTTYYWKVFPTVSQDEDISIASLHPILIDGKPIKAVRSGDADNVPLWRFTTGK
jgi:hypothetical protein